MNTLGIHSLVFTPVWNETAARRVFEQAREIGYDTVEVLMGDLDAVDVAMTARLAQEHDVGVMVTMTGAPTADLSNPDPDVYQRGEALVRRALAMARDMGSPLLGGPTYSAVQRYPLAPSGFARERIVEAYGRLATAAEQMQLRLGLEALNRYESNFVNTLDQAAAIVRAVGSSALFVHADLFHMAIEEGPLDEAIRRVGDVLGYVHVAESNRGGLGGGNTDWPRFFGALDEVGYHGPITYESFSPTVLGPVFAGFIALWRDQWTDPEALARSGLAFLRDQITAARARSIDGGR